MEMENLFDPPPGFELSCNPTTGKIEWVRKKKSFKDDDRTVLLDMGPHVQGFFGGCGMPAAEAAHIRGHSSAEFIDAVVCNFPHNERVKLPEYYIDYYKIQSLQKLGGRNNQVSVPIWIDLCHVGTTWVDHLQQAIEDINVAALGVNLFSTNDESNAKITIQGLPSSEYKCYTKGNILCCPVAKIYLNPLWGDKKRTSCHELLHALGFEHEHQRRDRDLTLLAQDNEVEGTWQYCKLDKLLGITRFDPFSILMYPEQQNELCRNYDDSVWFTKPTTEYNREMSELDKVSLNNLYRPCKGADYSPTRFGSVTGLWYCGRFFGKRTPGHDGYCGPTNGPNCPACRVLKSDRVVSLWEKGKWQGWTGAVYCGRWFGVQDPGHDGYCGPNNGPSCPECYEELLKRD